MSGALHVRENKGDLSGGLDLCVLVFQEKLIEDVEVSLKAAVLQVFG